MKKLIASFFILTALGYKLFFSNDSTLDILVFKSFSLKDSLLLAFIMTMPIVTIAFLDVYIWKRFSTKKGSPPPGVLILLINLLIWLSFSLLTMAVVFEKSIASFLAASGVTLAVIGFAVQNMIADFFYGMTLALERPFDLGDWIKVDDMTGKVESFSWRAVSILNRDNLLLIIPNSKIAQSEFINYDRPTRLWRNSYSILLSELATTWQVERLFFSSLHQVPQLRAINPMDENGPELFVKEMNDLGFTWELRFWTSSYEKSFKELYLFQRALMRNLNYSDIHIPKNEIFYGDIKEAEKEQDEFANNWIDRIPLFDSLSSEEKDIVKKGTKINFHYANKIICKQGEPGSSLYVIYEGTLDVYVTNDESTITEESLGTNVALLRPGDFFGEMSFLTGSPRRATILPTVDSFIFEINKELLAPIIKNNPTIVESMARFLEQRTAENIKAMANINKSSKENRKNKSAFENIQNSIISFFS